MVEPSGKAPPAEPSGETSLVGSDRVLEVLRQLALRPAGVGLDELAVALQSAKPTVHRALASLRRAGFAVQDARGHYVLGDEFIRLAFTNHEARPDQARVQPLLEQLAERYGETAHFAVLEGRSIVYRAKVDPVAGAAKLASTVGGRNPAHTTAVGKLMLADRLQDDAAVREWVDAEPLEARTSRTMTSVDELAGELRLIRERGYSTDDQENEVGVNCLAVPIYLSSPSTPSGGVSISALAYRTPLSTLVDDLPAIQAIVRRTNPYSRTDLS